MPHRYVNFTGFVLRDGRRAGLCWDKRPRCINDHRLKTHDLVISDAIVTCMHRENGQAPCGTKLYVAPGKFLGQRVWLVVEITEMLVKRVHAAGDDSLFLEKCRILDCVLPGVELDFEQARLERDERERSQADPTDNTAA